MPHWTANAPPLTSPASIVRPLSNVAQTRLLFSQSLIRAVLMADPAHLSIFAMILR